MCLQKIKIGLEVEMARWKPRVHVNQIVPGMGTGEIHCAARCIGEVPGIPVLTVSGPIRFSD
jgi:hypothetical protein